ncbi:MAG: Flagella basal body P-ring formation protein FlgA precursor [Pseudomonadota bacterium]
MTPENVKTSTSLEIILQMLCRTFQTPPNPSAKRWVVAGVLIGGGWVHAWAQNATANPGWSALEQGAKQFVVNTYKVEAPTVSIMPMDHRIKFEACNQDIVFDQPFGNKQSVRARCAQPVWQHFVMVQMRSGLGAQIGNATQNNTVTRVVWVASQALKRGTPIQPGLFKAVEQTVPSQETRLVSDERELTNMELLRDLPANTPLKLQDIKAATMVKRGQQVTVAVGEGKGFLITVRAEAQQDGLLGEQIRLKNPESGRSLSAVITGVNMARGL